MTHLQSLVRAHRLALGLTQRGAASRCQLSLTTWQSLERRGVDPSTFQDLTLARVAGGLGIPWSEVFHAVGREPPQPPRRGLGAGPAVTVDVDLDELLERLASVLVELNEASEESFFVAYSLALETADRLLELHRHES